MTAFPPTINDPVGTNFPAGVFGRSRDPAKLLIGRTRYQRPVLSVPPNGPKFEWPMGVEGISVRGAPGISEHRYLGDNAPVVQIVHRDARRIELRGQFPGVSGSVNMRDLIEVVTAEVPKGYWILTLPSSLFPKQQYVVVENYEFDHPEDERNDSWTYEISLIRTGVGRRVKSAKKTKSPVNPTGKKRPHKGKTTRVFTTKNGGNTLRAVAKLVYGNANRWREIYVKNQKALAKLNTPLAQLQYKRLPYGMKLNF